jgi:hypothetical protein
VGALTVLALVADAPNRHGVCGFIDCESFGYLRSAGVPETGEWQPGNL